MSRLGMVGTMVWDSIYGPDAGPDDAVEAWGGIAYSLAAADVALGPEWTLFPLIKVGEDLLPEAERFFETLACVGSLEGIRGVPESNNRVDLYYHEDDHGRRCEKLTGGVPGWTEGELLPLLADCDALYINFIAGWELDLAVATAARQSIDGPIYADVHSLMLGVAEDGIRRLRPLPDWRSWMENFDYVQLNEDELDTLAEGSATASSAVSGMLDMRTRAVFVTLGERGVEWTVAADVGAAAGEAGGAIAPVAPIVGADPTGCGDVWGASCFASLLAGNDLESAARTATGLAERNAGFQGADGLREYLAS